MSQGGVAMKSQAYPTSPFHGFQPSDILAPQDLSLTSDALNTTLDSDQDQSEKYEPSASNRQSWSSATTAYRSQQSEYYDSLGSLQNRRFNPSVEGGSSSVTLRRRGIRRHISVPQSELEPCTSSVVLDLLPWLVGLIWLATLSLGGR